MPVVIPRPVCNVGASFNLDVSEVRRQILASIIASPGDDTEAKLETVVQLLAVEHAINAMLAAQDELTSSPQRGKP
jgi:hypothetical protein